MIEYVLLFIVLLIVGIGSFAYVNELDTWDKFKAYFSGTKASTTKAPSTDSPATDIPVYSSKAGELATGPSATILSDNTSLAGFSVTDLSINGNPIPVTPPNPYTLEETPSDFKASDYKNYFHFLNDKKRSFNESLAECERLGYNLASLTDLTNARAMGFEACEFGWTKNGIGMAMQNTNTTGCEVDNKGIAFKSSPLDDKYSAYCKTKLSWPSVKTSSYKNL